MRIDGKETAFAVAAHPRRVFGGPGGNLEAIFPAPIEGDGVIQKLDGKIVQPVRFRELADAREEPA